VELHSQYTIHRANITQRYSVSAVDEGQC